MSGRRCRCATLTEPILYSFRRCPYAMRARLALLVSETRCEIREVKLRDKPAELIAASPKATVPVLVLPDGQVIDESLDIMRWALRRNDPEGWLAGDDAGLIAANDGPFKYHLDRYKYPERHGSDPGVHRAEGLAMLAALEARLAAQAWLCGDRRMLADAAIMPFVRQFAAVDRAWFDAQALPAVQRWLAGQLAAPLFAAAMIQRPQWRAEG
ncbi:glutathione S-transferase [Sphingomonas naasensis]|uniref:Glutathione S-transferase n=1 Tax=Sphingomonas naasensis TaxID=1344951 RepID=A0A4S1WEW9_9SPHN|nr:glutathione S-transferase [Sphingomonas naasensis]NIJ22332.1 glutathione S-transferase [Sphingomonas naasensis]TGX40665.1 glutathione S-transferase [Sphingomonas naasensis]